MEGWFFFYSPWQLASPVYCVGHLPAFLAKFDLVIINPEKWEMPSILDNGLVASR
jgi:hypothetical protein